MKALLFFSVSMTIVFLTPKTILQAQVAPVVFFGDDEIEVSDDQDDGFDELEESIGYDLESLGEKLKDLKSEYERKRKLFEVARFNLLTPIQKTELEKRRRERIERESIQQQASDIEFLTKFLPLLRAMQSIQALEILEGPQRNGDGTIPSPSEGDKVVRFDRHYFFSDALAIDADAQITVVSTLRNYRSFSAYAGGKLCGGFHPDANIKVRTHDDAVSILVCFGCAEARIIAKDIDMMVELEPDAYSTLRTVCYQHFRKHDAARRSE